MYGLYTIMFRDHRIGLRRAAAAAAAAFVLLGLTVSAHATVVYFWDDVMTQNTQFPARIAHPLTAVSARKLTSNGNDVCVNALDGGSLVGQWNCVDSYDDVAVHHYCGCGSRNGVVWNDGSGATYIRARYDYWRLDTA